MITTDQIIAYTTTLLTLGYVGYDKVLKKKKTDVEVEEKEVDIAEKVRQLYDELDKKKQGEIDELKKLVKNQNRTINGLKGRLKDIFDSLNKKDEIISKKDRSIELRDAKIEKLISISESDKITIDKWANYANTLERGLKQKDIVISEGEKDRELHVEEIRLLREEIQILKNAN